MARPTKFTQEIADRICDEIVAGKSLRTVCKAVNMPSPSMVFRWLANDEYKEFREQYRAACEERSEALVEDIFDIADNGTNDWMTENRRGKDVEVPNHEVLARSKLRVEARMWYAGKVKPKKYGTQRIEQESKVEGDISIKWADD